MARQLKVFAVSFLLACLFCFSASAEFSTSDSLNLGLIKTYCQTISNQFTMIEGVTSLLKDVRNYLNVSWSGGFANQVISSLNSISSLLGASSKDFNTDDALYCFDSYHYNGTENSSYPGMINGVSNLVLFQNTSLRYLNTFLPPGRYYLNINIANQGSISTPICFVFENNIDGLPNLNVLTADAVGGLYGGVVKRYGAYFDVTDPDGFFFGDCYIMTDHQNPIGNAYVYKVEGSEAILSDSLTPSIDSHGHDLEQGVNQMEDLENTAFDSLDTSIGSLDFSGSALGQVVSGFTFIRAVFSAVYSSSPYISVLINLSCMLGVLALFLRVQPRFSRWEREHRDRPS